MEYASTSDQIYDAAVRHATKRGFHFGPGADTHFRTIAEQAAMEIAAIPSPAERERHEQNANAAFASVIDAMIAARPLVYADDPENLNKMVIGELTLGKALQDLCPIWPFCK